MLQSRIDDTKKKILAEALKHYADLKPAEWTEDALGDDWAFYNEVAKQLEEDGLVNLKKSTFRLLRVLLTDTGEAYCKANGIY